MKLGVYVGSFNPIHKGHIGIVRYLINKKILDYVIIVPTDGYWNKTDLLDLNHRINMIKTYENDNIIVDTELNELPYTYLILNKLEEKYPLDELHLIIGSDNLKQFSKWKNIDEIFKHKIVVINRNNYNSEELINKHNFNNEVFKVIDNPFKYNYNSTEIRKKLKNNLNVEKYLDDEIILYIKEYGLYE